MLMRTMQLSKSQLSIDGVCVCIYKIIPNHMYICHVPNQFSPFNGEREASSID